MAKIPELKPYSFPSKTASEHTTAEWELGIPPAPINLLILNFLLIIKSTITLKICIKNHKQNGITKHLLEIILLKVFIIYIVLSIIKAHQKLKFHKLFPTG